MADPQVPAPKRPTTVQLTWVGEHRFDAATPGGAASRIDAGGPTGPGPVAMFLSALGACAAVDVVDILAKRRTPAERMSVAVTGERAQAIPARVTRIRLDYQIDGPAVDRVHAERAVDLAISKYCSVRASLDPAIPIAFSVTLNGQPGTVVAIGTIAA